MSLRPYQESGVSTLYVLLHDSGANEIVVLPGAKNCSAQATPFLSRTLRTVWKKRARAQNNRPSVACAWHRQILCACQHFQHVAMLADTAQTQFGQAVAAFSEFPRPLSSRECWWFTSLRYPLPLWTFQKRAPTNKMPDPWCLPASFYTSINV